MELDLLKDTDLLLMMEKVIRGEIFNATHPYAEANNKYMKNYGKNKKSKYFDVNNLYGWAMSQNLPLDGFKWVEETSQ